MNTEKFTPGEWEVSEFSYNNGESTYFYISSGLKEVSVCLPTGRVSKEEAKANAALISAAPGMYQMLSRIYERLICLHSNKGAIGLEEIEKVLKKARGEE